MTTDLKRIALTQRVERLAEYNESRDQLDQRWAPLLLGAGLIPVPVPTLCDDIDSWFNEMRIDGIIFTGGNDLSAAPNGTNISLERDLLEKKAHEFARQSGLRVLGVCRGMQHLLVLSGIKLKKLDGHVGTDHRLEHKSFLPFPDKARSYHNFGVNLSDVDFTSVIPLANSPDNSLEAAYFDANRSLGVMWHPERELETQDVQVDLLRRFFFSQGL